MVCMICGEKVKDDNHSESAQHQLAEARMLINAVDSFKLCPWCKEQTKRWPCDVAKHKKMLACCRAFAAQENERG